MLPDDVWRPLVLGNISNPTGLAVDTQRKQLFVIDTGFNKIFRYNLLLRPSNDGNTYLETDAVQNIVAEGYAANMLAVNDQGDLYFTGKGPSAADEMVYRIDSVNLKSGDNLQPPMELYTSSNSGSPNPGVYMPSGIAVDTFSVFWGNSQDGSTYGSIVKAPRQNLGSQTSSNGATCDVLVNDQPSVLAVTVTNNLVFYLTPDGIYGTPKTQSGSANDTAKISGPANTDTNVQWDPRAITYDNDAMLYISDLLQGKVYMLSAMDLNPHTIQTFTDAPFVLGIGVLDASDSIGSSARLSSKRSFAVWLVSLLLVASSALL